MVQLTDTIIKKAFDELNIDRKYFEIFKKEVERCYSELQKDCPDVDDEPEEESNVDASIRIYKEFMEYYVHEKEKGQSDTWAETYARNRLLSIEEYISYLEAYKAVEDKEEKEKELNIHVESVSEDPLFRKRYKYLFTELMDDPKKYAESYCNDYRRMIALGKSEIFAHAYADYHDNHLDESCIIYAQAYEIARNHGMDDINAFCFGDTCTEAVDHGVCLLTNQFLKRYQEDWQKDFYFTLIKHKFEESRHRQMSQSEELELWKESFGYEKPE